VQLFGDVAMFSHRRSARHLSSIYSTRHAVVLSRAGEFDRQAVESFAEWPSVFFWSKMIPLAEMLSEYLGQAGFRISVASLGPRR